MLKLAVFLFAVLMAAVPCVAGVGEFGIYSDAEGNNCVLADYGGGALVTTYVVHHFYAGDQATGSRFGIELSGGMSWIFLSFQSPFQGIPAAQADISLAYGSCINTTTNIGWALWVSPVAAPVCSSVSMKAADSLPTIIVADCAFNEQPPGFTNFMAVNPNVTCWCYTATQATTWGSVKALYR